MNDTSPQIEKKMSEMILKKSPFGSSMHATAKYLVVCAILAENPNISPTALKQQIFLKFYQDDYTAEQCQKILNHFQNLEP